MTMTYKTVTGQITQPGTNVGIRAKVTATPLTTNAMLTFTGDNRISIGPQSALTDSNGNLGTLKIPTNVDIGELYWHIFAESIDKVGGVPKRWTLKAAVAITGTGTVNLRDLAEIDTTAVDSQIIVNISDLVVDAENARDDAESEALAAESHKTAAASSATAAAGSATAASGSASTASTAASTATTKAGEAAASATAADTSADAAAADRSAVEDLVGAAEAVAVSNDTIIAGRINDSASATAGALTASFAGSEGLPLNPLTNPLFAVLGDGSNDDTAGLQAAIDAVQSALSGGTPLGLGGGHIHIPHGEYVISDTLLVYRQGLTITGEGWTNGPLYNPANPPQKSRGTTLRWKAGSGKKPMLQVRDCYGFTIDNIRFQGGHVTDPTNVPSCAINFNSATGDNVGSNGKLFVDRVRIGIYSYTPEVDDHTVDVGILFDGLNANNDEYVISRSYIGYTVTHGIKIAGTQSVWGIVRDTLLDHCPIGVETNSDFSSDNLHFNGCTLDYKINAGSSAWISRYAAENSVQFMVGGPGATVTINGGDLDCNAIDTTKPMFDFSGATGAQILTLRNVDFNSALTSAMKIKMGQAAPSSLGATETIGLVIEDCRSLTPSNLDLALVDATDKRDIYWRGGGYFFVNDIRGATGRTYDTTRFDPTGTITKVKAADTSLSATTTLTDDPDLQVPLQANRVYEVEVLLFHTGDPAADFSAGINLPAGSTNTLGEWGIALAASSTTGSLKVVAGSGTTGGGGLTSGDISTSQKIPYLAKGIVRTGSTVGNLKVQWAQQTSSATATTVYTNSYLKVRRIG